MFCGQHLWWPMRLHIFHWSCWDTFWIPNDHMDLCQTPRVQVPYFSRHWGHVVNLDQSQASLRKNPVPTYGPTWVVLWLLFFRSAPSTFPNKRSTLKGPFRGVPSRYIILRYRPYPPWHWSLVCHHPITLGWLPQKHTVSDRQHH